MIRLKYALKSILKGCSRQNTKADEVTAKMKKIRLEMLASRLRWYSLAVNRPLTHGRIKRRVRLNLLTRRRHIVCRAVWTNLDGTVSSTVTVVCRRSFRRRVYVYCSERHVLRYEKRVSDNVPKLQVCENLGSMCKFTTNIGPWRRVLSVWTPHKHRSVKTCAQCVNSTQT